MPAVERFNQLTSLVTDGNSSIPPVLVNGCMWTAFREIELKKLCVLDKAVRQDCNCDVLDMARF